jgi:hypothetical protein
MSRIYAFDKALTTEVGDIADGVNVHFDRFIRLNAKDPSCQSGLNTFGVAVRIQLPSDENRRRQVITYLQKLETRTPLLFLPQLIQKLEKLLPYCKSVSLII